MKIPRRPRLAKGCSETFRDLKALLQKIPPLALAATLTACGPGDEGDRAPGPPAEESAPASTEASGPEAPAFLQFDRDDLATAGLGIGGLRGPAPEPEDPAAPTAAELYRLAVHNNYRGLVDVSDAGGFGRLYGPRADELPVPGTEYWALGRVSDGATHVMILQVPDTFPGERACLVAAPASGSRGPLGAIGTAGDWGLRRGCAVVYTDKGAGPWMANLGDGRAFAITGERVEQSAGTRENGRSTETTDEPVGGRASGRPDSAPANAAEPTIIEPFSTRTWPSIEDVAVKHAHSGRNPEAHWGAMVLDSLRFALKRLNAGHRPADAPAFQGDGILVIAASLSNGGGAVLAAAEQDPEDLIDGVVAAEPNVYVTSDTPLKFAEDGGSGLLGARPLYDYATLAAVFGPCAVLSERFSDAPMATNLGMLKGLLEARCQGLASLGLVEGEDTGARAEAAYAELLDHGLHPTAADAQPANILGNIWALVAGVYANAYGRFEPTDRLCGIGFRAFDASNRPVDVDPGQAARLFGTSSGVPPAAGIDIAPVGDDGAAKLIFAPSEAAGGPAYGLDQARCLRQLWTGEGRRADRVLEGVRATALTGDLGGTPALVVHGRSDALVWVNHSSRPYYAANQALDGERSNLRYLEVTNAQHFDALLGTPGFAARFVPLHVYFERALDRLHAHLTGDAALPPSQVIPTRPRGSEDGATPPLAGDHVPPIANTGHAEVIQWQDGTLRIPR